MNDVDRSTLTRTDRLRLGWYLQRLSWALQDYPRRERRAALRQVRQDTLAAAGDVGMRTAVDELGHPRALAERYVAQLDRPLPRWTSGAVAAALACGALLYLGMAYTTGTLHTLEALGGGTLTTYPLGGEVVFTADDRTFAVESTLSWQGGLLFAAVAGVAFALASRVWRVLP
ncbi:hypothetical protein [Actinotalea sp. Marseille-Q4924]|uniref:hypothetical protein n=1 Tax=Actinotalea sp. Marseille-Q4924 TaxID=2866571 RepID=UPI001CE446D7|nr:hypothetical protein [Actinotalea sp. Marseille-Q4924]